MNDRALINAALGWEPVNENIEQAIREHYPIINEAYKTLQLSLKSIAPKRGLRVKINPIDDAPSQEILNDLERNKL